MADTFPTAPADAPPLPPGRELTLRRRGTLYVRETGPADGVPVVLLHGWTVTSDLNWFPSFDPLGERFRVIAFDHRGHGRGIRSRRRFRLVDCADDAVAVLAHLGVERAVVVGYSLGGCVAQLAARRHPDRVRGMVLAATSPSFRASPARLWPSIMAGVAAASRLSPGLTNRIFERRLDARTSHLDDWATREVRSNDPRMLLEAGASLFNFDSRRWLSELTTPAAVVVTEHDAKIRPEVQRSFTRRIEGATAFSARTGHDGCVTAPDEFLPPMIDAIDHVAQRSVV